MPLPLPPTPDALTPLEDFIRQSALPCLALALLPGAETRLDGSKVGGAVALPASFEWPQHEGRPLGFLLQINLAEVVPGPGFGLPEAGLLSFFYDLDKCPWNPEIGGAFRVVFTPPGAALEATVALGDGYRLPEARVVFREGLSLPYFGSAALGDFAERVQEAFGDDVSGDDDAMDETAEAYGDYCREVAGLNNPNPEGGTHRMFGHPENIQDDMRAHDPEWTLLLQLASDDALGMAWGDSGMLYFWVRRADLAARRFDRVTLVLQCS